MYCCVQYFGVFLVFLGATLDCAETPFAKKPLFSVPDYYQKQFDKMFVLVSALGLLPEIPAGALISHFLKGRSLKGRCNIRMYVPLCVCVCVPVPPVPPPRTPP